MEVSHEPTLAGEGRTMLTVVPDPVFDGGRSTTGEASLIDQIVRAGARRTPVHAKRPAAPAAS